MARVFISHSSRDSEAAGKLFDWLKSQGFDRGFLDIDKHQGIPPGAKWEQRLYDELERAQAVILILTKNWFDSKWCFAEFAQARSRGKAIFPVIISPDGDQYVGDDLQKIKLWRDEKGGLERLAVELTEVALQSQGGFDFPPGRAPYPGFFAFDEDDAAIYFGRDDDIRRLIQRLDSRRIEGGRRFVAVLGESGTGKSSLLRAGVIPRLRRAKRDWIVLSAFRPEEDPFVGLARSLRQAGIDTTSARLIDADPEALAAELAARHDAHHAAILVAVDQFEEIFTRTPAERSAPFIALLARMLRSGLPFVVAATMRSDHLGDLQRIAALSTELEEFSLSPLPVERMGEIIRGPARIAGVEVDEGFVAGITADARTTDALPLVAFALRRLYDDLGPDHHLTLAQYERLRDAAAGLSPLETIVRDTAGKVLGEAKPTDAELAALREAFVPGLVRVNEEGGFVRQAAGWNALPEGSRRLIAALAGPAARLLVVGEKHGERVVEVAHEALFRVWPLLVGWLNEEKEFLIGRNRLEKALADWQGLSEADKDKGLLSGILLRRARQWLIDHPARFSPGEAAFIRASEAADEERRRQDEEQRRALEQARLRQVETERDAARRIQQRTRIAAVLLGLIALVAVGAGIFAIRAEQQAAEEALRATQEADRANAEATRATQNLAIARDTVSRVVFDIAQGLRDVEGMRVESIRTILSRVQEAVDALVKAAPDDLDVLRSRAAMLTLFGDVYLKAGDSAAAAKAYEEAIALRRRLAGNEQSGGQQERELIVVLMRYGDLKVRTGESAAALAAYTEGLEIARKIEAGAPGNAAALADLLVGMVKIGDMRLATDDAQGALASYSEALGIARRLTAIEPANLEWRRSLMQCLVATGNAQGALGSAADALAAYEQALTIARDLLSKDQGNTQARRDLVLALQAVGDRQLAAGKNTEALASYGEALKLMQSVAASDPDAKDWQSDLAIALEKVGDAKSALNDRDGALASYEEQLTIARRLAAADAGNAIWQRGLSVALQRLGDFKAKGNDMAGALAAYEESLGLARRLATSDPANLGWQRDLLTSLNKIGGMKVNLADVAGARSAFEEALTIARSLAARDPANVDHQVDLILAVAQAGNVILDDPAQRKALLREALALMDKLAAAGKLPVAMGALRPALTSALAEGGQ